MDDGLVVVMRKMSLSLIEGTCFVCSVQYGPMRCDTDRSTTFLYPFQWKLLSPFLHRCFSVASIFCRGAIDRSVLVAFVSLVSCPVVRLDVGPLPRPAYYTYDLVVSVAEGQVALR